MELESFLLGLLVALLVPIYFPKLIEKLRGLKGEPD